jgi:acyl carrier protein
MKLDDVYAALTEIFADVFDNPAISIAPGTSAADIPGWDSMTHINLVVAVEQHFKIKFKIAEIDRLKNVGDLAGLIAERTGR